MGGYMMVISQSNFKMYGFVAICDMIFFCVKYEL